MSIACRLITLIILISPMQNAYSALTLNGTRFIYNENDKSIEIQIKNNDKRDFGGQVWIDNIDQPKSKTLFATYPALFKLSSQSIQSVKFINIAELPKDRESVFHINVQEIPPNSETENALTIAMNIKVKMFYRPDDLPLKREFAENNIIVHRQDNKLVLNNNTPFYFAITEVKELSKLSRNVYDDLAIFSPYSKIYLPVEETNKTMNTLTLLSINDYGGINEYKLPILVN